MGGTACIIAGTGAALAGCSSAGSATAAGGAGGETVVGTEQISWDDESDILIVGTGIAGLAAAMEPALAGKSVLFAEKQGNWGGDSALSCWFGFANGTKVQADAGITTTIDEYWEASKDKLTAPPSEDFTYDWYADWVKGKTYANTKFIDTAVESFGATFQKPASQDELPRLYSSVILPGDGIASGYSDVMKPIHDKLEEMGCRFEFGKRAIALIKDTEGTVIGCRFRDEESGEKFDVKAGAVVLATGSFVDNGEMVAKYLPDWAPYGTLVTASMGEGQLLGAAAGAKLYGMETSMVYCNLMGDIPNCTTWGYWTPIVMVLPDGKRFIKEDQSHDAAKAAVAAGFREWWSICDQTALDRRCISSSVEKNFKAHADAYVTADNLDDLAAGMNVPVDTLKATFAHYDELVASGTDADFGKKAWLASLQPPYHALRLNVCRYKTSGGLVVNGDNVVIDDAGEPIPGLYACGAVTTLSYAAVSTCCATGYFVGESLAAL